MYIYDFKYPDLSTIAYNHMKTHRHCYTVKPKFYVINFDNPRSSHRCNPINPTFMTDISDAYESAYSTQMDSLIPASKISNLTQGMFVGAVSDNFDERIEQKIFHAEIVVDNARVVAESKVYKQIPDCTNFIDANGNDRMKETIQENYNRIKAEAAQIVADELNRIGNDPELQHLLKKS